MLKRFIVLKQLLSRIIRDGTVTIIGPRGGQMTFGAGDPKVTVRIRDRAALLELGLHPDLRLGELYMGGRIAIEEGDIADLMSILMANLARARPPVTLRVVRACGARSSAGRNTIPHRCRRRMSRITTIFPASSTICSSIATGNIPAPIFPRPAKASKRRRSARSATSRPSSISIGRTCSVLDIGSGWGGLALDLARDGDANVLGVTLSEEQLALAKEPRGEGRAFASAANSSSIDYRALKGTFDRVVSVGMFEHVGVPYYPAYFAKVRDLLNDDGVALIHTIGRSDGPGVTNPWISKYIFPGGYTPALSEMLPGDRARRADRHRCRSAAAPLCRDAEGMAPALQGAVARGGRAL